MQFPHVDHFTDQGLMDLHRLYAGVILNMSFVEKRMRLVEISRHLHDKLVARVPVSFLWEIEKLQRDLNINIE